MVSAVVNVQSQYPGAPTYQLVSSAKTAAAARTSRTRLSKAGRTFAAVRCTAWASPPGLSVKPARSCSTRQVFRMVSPNCLFRRGGQGMGAGAELGLGGAGGRRGLQGVGAMHLAAGGAVAPVRDQMRDVRPDRGDLLDELLDRLQRGHRPAAVGTARQRDLGVLIDVVGDSPMHPRVAAWPTGPLLGAVGDLLGFAPPERGGLAGRGPLLLVELLLELSVLVPQVPDRLLQGGDLSAQLLILLPESLESRSFSGSHDPPRRPDRPLVDLGQQGSCR